MRIGWPPRLPCAFATLPCGYNDRGSHTEPSQPVGRCVFAVVPKISNSPKTERFWCVLCCLPEHCWPLPPGILAPRFLSLLVMQRRPWWECLPHTRPARTGSREGPHFPAEDRDLPYLAIFRSKSRIVSQIRQVSGLTTQIEPLQWSHARRADGPTHTPLRKHTAGPQSPQNPGDSFF